jgi:hypothetical protein
MVAAPTPVALYVTRWKKLLAASVCGALLAVDLLNYFVWPTPETSPNPWVYEEPAKTLLFLGVLLGATLFLLLALYWTLTPLPLLRVTASEVIYRPFPLRARTIHWDEVEYVLATATRRATTMGRRSTTLTLFFALKSPRIEATNTPRRCGLT